MEKQMQAEREKRGSIFQLEGEKQSAINVAEGEKQICAVANATADGVKAVAEAAIRRL
jgi:regulator of protease activity HflC (stomatin/prohibitin superfamily)